MASEQAMRVQHLIDAMEQIAPTRHAEAWDNVGLLVGDPEQAIFFVGYTDPGTPGGRLKASKPGDTFVFSASAGEVTRRCEIEDFDLTAHANREDLLRFVSDVQPRAVLLGHGEDESRNWFEEQIRQRHPNMKVIQPKPGEAVEA